MELAEEYSDDHMAQGFVLTMPFVLPCVDEGFDFEPSPVPSSFQIVADSAFPELSQSADDSGWQVTEARGVLIVMKDRLEDAKALYVVQEEEEDESLFESADGTKWQVGRKVAATQHEVQDP
ncbi:unnamed protein product [Prorocentrum cordatum]|uniref:Uncharacterized protein n=1 Tax=Prorocentrum cordatum TaxID=2364126 RepID=A0ABN9SER3_9DINO|nr:unnamed protein product [Polarella glacialis]